MSRRPARGLFQPPDAPASPLGAPEAQLLAQQLYAGRYDRHHEPEVFHLQAVVDGLPPEDHVVGWLHDAVEDGLIDPSHLVARHHIATEDLQVLLALTRRMGVPYRDYIEAIATFPGPVGLRARRIKLADLRANCQRRGGPWARYQKAIHRLREAQSALGEP